MNWPVDGGTTTGRKKLECFAEIIKARNGNFIRYIYIYILKLRLRARSGNSANGIGWKTILRVRLMEEKYLTKIVREGWRPDSRVQ